MNNPKKEQLSWKKAIQFNLRAINFLFHHVPEIFISSLIFAVWKALTPYISIYLSALIIDELAGYRNTQRLMRLVLITLITTSFISFGSAWLGKWKNTVSANTYFKIKSIYTQKFLSMDFAVLDDTKTHEVMSKIERARYNRGVGLTKIVTFNESIMSSLFSLFGGITMTISLFTMRVPETAGVYTILNHPLFNLGLISIMLAITYIAPLFVTKAQSYWARCSEEHALSNLLITFYGFRIRQKDVAPDVRIYQQEQIANKRTLNKDSCFCSNGLYGHLCKGPIGFYNAASSALSVLFTGVAYAFICLKAWAGTFGVGAVTQYVSAITKVSAGVSALIEQLGIMYNNAPFLENEFEFLDIPNKMYQGSIPIEKRSDNEYEIKFQNVSFKYPGNEAYALKNVSFTFKVGQRLAVVGMNGSGKTTMIKLLCRLYDPTEGSITLNGIDIRKYDYQEYLSIFSVVFQDFKLFPFEIGQNVASGTHYEEEQVIVCLEKAGFGARLIEMPDKLQTYLYKDYGEDGVNISGGEAQKIAIARALYKDTPFIILDEPTAALDPIAEAEIYVKFNEIVGNKTAIYISHRLSSCRFCDEVVVFDRGEVVQQGSHEALVTNINGKYYELWQAQAQYYI